MNKLVKREDEVEEYLSPYKSDVAGPNMYILDQQCCISWDLMDTLARLRVFEHIVFM